MKNKIYFPITNLLLFQKQLLEKTGESCSRNCFEEFFKKSFVKTVERSTDEDETKMTTRAPDNQTNEIISKLKCWLRFSLCKNENETQKLAEDEKTLKQC